MNVCVAVVCHWAGGCESHNRAARHIFFGVGGNVGGNQAVLDARCGKNVTSVADGAGGGARLVKGIA